MNRSYITRLVIIFLSAAGVGIMVYLTYVSFTQNQSFCDISKEVSCDIVVNSLYSKVFGVPVSVLGLFYFVTVLFLALLSKKEKAIKTIFLLTLLSIFPSLYLTFTEIFFIKSICLLCETSKVLMGGILAVSFATMKFSGEKNIFRSWCSVLTKKESFIISRFVAAHAAGRRPFSVRLMPDLTPLNAIRKEKIQILNCVLPKKFPKHRHFW